MRHFLFERYCDMAREAIKGKAIDHEDALRRARESLKDTRARPEVVEVVARVVAREFFKL